MALMTPEQFEASLKELKPRVFMNGKRVTDILTNKNTRTVVEANKASYAWALDPKYKDIMTCFSPLVNEVVNRYTYVSASIEDLVKKAEAGTFTAEMLGTCIYRCVGYDAFHALAAPPGRWTGTWAPTIGRASWNISRPCRKKTCPWPGP